MILSRHLDHLESTKTLSNIHKHATSRSLQRNIHSPGAALAIHQLPHVSSAPEVLNQSRPQISFQTFEKLSNLSITKFLRYSPAAASEAINNLTNLGLDFSLYSGPIIYILKKWKQSFAVSYINNTGFELFNSHARAKIRKLIIQCINSTTNLQERAVLKTALNAFKYGSRRRCRP